MRLSLAVGWGCLPGLLSFTCAHENPSVETCEPQCAHACQRSISPLALTCSSHDENADKPSDNPPIETSPKCRASNAPYLTTLAWCIHTHCTSAELDASSIGLSLFWERFASEDSSILPKLDYLTALQLANTTTKRLPHSNMLNSTSLVDPATYAAQYNALQPHNKSDLKRATHTQSYLSSPTNLYGITILLTALALPILLTLLSHLLTRTRLLATHLNPHLITRSTLPPYQVRPLPYLLGNVPTCGQSLYILTLTVLITVLCAVNHHQHRPPHTWYPALNTHTTIVYIFQRTGVFSFALLPVTILFSSRNNILFWATNWSHSTYLLLHRWVGRLCVALGLVHTLLALPLYYPGPETGQGYWIWGAVAVVAMVVLVLGSGLYVRKFMYEAFLVGHVLLSVVVIVGCWYHVHRWMGGRGSESGWGYVAWLLAAGGIWVFDRLVRIGRIAGNGVRRARVREIGQAGEYVRVDIEGVGWGMARPGMHVYAQFPMLNKWRPWENHPFSVVPTELLRGEYGEQRSCSSASTRQSSDCSERDIELDEKFRDVEKRPRLSQHTMSREEVAITPARETTSEITLFVKKSSGLTKRFQAHDHLLTLLDGPYPNNSTSAVLRCERLLLIGGGIGITSVLPWISHHSNVKLCWGIRESARCLVNELEDALSRVEEMEVKVGRRLNIKEIISNEMSLGWSQVCVIVSGPGGLCDDVRAEVALAGSKGKMVFELEVDAYSW